MAAVHQRGYVLHCLQAVPPTRCAAILANWQCTVAQQTMVEHNNCGVHCKLLAIESGGASTIIVGTLLAPVRNAIAGLFYLVYRTAKPAHIPWDDEALHLTGGIVRPSYHSKASVATITHSIADPIQSVKGEAIKGSNFFALASNHAKRTKKEQQPYINSQEIEATIHGTSGNSSSHAEHIRP